MILESEIDPKQSYVFSKDFGVKIKGFVVGAETRDDRCCAQIVKGGVGQNFIRLKVFAGQYNTKAFIKVTTHQPVKIK